MCAILTGIQVALEKEEDEYSIFTKRIIEGIETGAADGNGEGIGTMNELYSYVHDRVLDEMLRIGREGIVTFPNFGHWRCRLMLGVQGTMPVSSFMPHTWYNTPNIHFCTVKDAESLCRERGIRILDRDVVGNTNRQPMLSNRWPNLFATTAIYRITR